MHRLAAAAGIARSWRDVTGRDQTVPDQALAAVLTALGYHAESEAAISHSFCQIMEERCQSPAMLVAEVGQAIPLPWQSESAELVAEDGRVLRIQTRGGMLTPPDLPGYYRLLIGQQEIVLAVAPPACPTIADLGLGPTWAPAIQIPSLRGTDGRPFGDFGHLDAAVRAFARHGAGGVAISPVHALLPGTGQDFSPYSPSSRLFLNGALADPALLGLPALRAVEGSELIDWQDAIPQRLAQLRVLFATLDPVSLQRVRQETAQAGEALRRHAIFDALFCHFSADGAAGWQDWPTKFHQPDAPAVHKFAREQAAEVEFHQFVQWLARGGLAAVQDHARTAGMPIGLIADLAVGVRPGGSDSWAMRGAMLDGLTIGAPPDPLGPHGQNWGLTSFSPHGLKSIGYAPWIELLRSAFAHAGGVRIDHAFGLARLWVIPQGGSPADGAYLTYPFADILRLTALEAHRARALVIAEDLGTAPDGFTPAIADKRMLGMRVLWFERAADHGFIGAQDYPAGSVAMTGTHDTPTVAGWWSGNDLAWASRLGRLADGVDHAKASEIRAWDRGMLWSTIGNGGPRPPDDQPAAAVDAALAHISRSPAALAVAPLEDILALEEQPNLPGTITEHPNWRRRLTAPIDQLLDEPEVAARLQLLNRPASN